MQIDWSSFGDCHQDTGYPEEVLSYIYNKYSPQTDLLDNPQDLYRYFQLLYIFIFRIYSFIHMYPCKRWSKRILQCSDFYFHCKLKPIMHWLRNNLNEIHWEERLYEFNHTSHFPYFVTGAVDTFPVRVQHPKNSELCRALFNPKYGTTVYKVELIVDFLGRITSFSGPHLGTKYDGHLFLKNWNKHPLHPSEFLLGDGHYAYLPYCIGPFKQPSGGALSLEEYYVNAVISFYRSRVEHMNARFEKHYAFRTPFRGGVESLTDILHITAHTTNVYNHFYPSYEFVGPWRHFG